MSLSDEEIQTFFDSMSDDDLIRIESLAQSTRKRRKKKMWADETFEDMKKLFDV